MLGNVSPSTGIIVALAFALGAAVGIGAQTGLLAKGQGDALDRLKAQFQRPKTLPVPAASPMSPQRVALGKMLFDEKRLSADNTVACSNCHDPKLAFGDGVARGKGIAKIKLVRHTPPLWNLAWARTLFWDGRAGSLEEQARGPIENPLEMGQPLGLGVGKLSGDATYVAAFTAAFGGDPTITETKVLQALASYERTLVSPPTRFDRWVEGDATALSGDEIDGFKLFTGKAKCSVCHSGWAFTDHAFHDIGLPGDDPGRGKVIDLHAVDHAFKTPGLRELAWTAPYMHDGSMATLDDVLRHYESGGIARQSRSVDMPPVISLTEEERSHLLAFLETLSSQRPPRPVDSIVEAGATERPPPAVATSTVSQKDKQFAPMNVVVKRGETLSILNDDTRPHNVRIFDPRLMFNSGLQEPGDRAALTFTERGTFEAFCGIHPNMRLSVEVQ